MDVGSLLGEEEAGEFRRGPYAVESLRRPQAVADLGRASSALYHTFGLDALRKKNLDLIDERTIVYAVGNAVVFEELGTQLKRYLLGLDEGGVGCVTVHPTKKYIAVGGRGYQPKIYVYTYPELKIVNVLSGGAERGYASLSFNVSGNKLASVASSPDFMLTVWDWQEERIALHAKAFGQDVFDVKFSLDDDRRLVTSGTGHIRFWKMASTFTGLKLQGYIGKFGKIELSDIQAFVELPDGKVVSGTETGSLLLWEGNFIKCRFVQVSGKPCHASEVTYVELDRKEKCVITASDDGFIRWWDFNAIDAAEVDSDVTMDFELFPLAEYYLGEGNGVRTMVDGGSVPGSSSRTFIILDKLGRTETLTFTLSMGAVDEGSPACKLFEVVAALTLPTESSAQLALPPSLVVCSEFHSGAITGMDSSPVDLMVATAGVDGSVKCWDISTKKLVASKSFSAGCTSLRWVPTTVDASSLTVLVGFADGVVRLLQLGEDDDGKATWVRKMVFKPHNSGVSDISFNPQGTMVATAGKDGNVFVFNCVEKKGPNGSYTPLRFFVVNPASQQQGARASTSCEKLCWSEDSMKLLCSCSDAVLREVDVSLLHERLSLDVETYEHVFPVVEYAGKVQPQVVQDAKAPGSPTSASEPPAPTDASSEPSSESKEGGSEGEGNNAPAAAAAAPSSPSSPSRKGGVGAVVEELPLIPVKVACAIYSSGRPAGPSGFFAGATVGPRAYLYECSMGVDEPVQELALGVYSAEGKTAVKAPLPSSLANSASGRFVVVGTTDGSVAVRPARFPEVFFRVSAHNGAVTSATLSFDDKYLLSTGADGTLQVHYILPGLARAAEELYKDIDAGVFGGEALKPPPSKPVPEPAYLFSITNMDPLPSPAAAAGAAAAAEAAEAEAEAAAAAKAADETLLAPVLPHVGSGDDTLELPQGAYSIQDAKLKSEEDAKLLTADALKEKIRLVVKTLQRDYQRVVESNAALPAEVRLPPSGLAVDGSYFDDLRKQGDEMVSEVHKEFAYEAEKAQLLKTKVTSFLMPDLLVEEMTIKAFTKSGRAKSIVRSLRTQGVSSRVHAVCERVRKQMREEEIRADLARSEARLALSASSGNVAVSMEDFVKAEETFGAGGAGDTALLETAANTGATGHSASGPAARREMRRQRKLKLKEHLKEKPNENDDDPRDLGALAHAEKTIGDYKLKSGDDYEVPEGQRINADGKMQQMAMLEESLTRLRLEFNERFLALRELKCDIVVNIATNNRRIREIDVEMLQPELSANLWEPSIDVSEFPDDRGEVTQEELDRYMEERKKAAWIKCSAVGHKSVTNAKTKVLRSIQTKEIITTVDEAKERLVFGAPSSSSSSSEDLVDGETAESSPDQQQEQAQKQDLIIPFSAPATHLSLEPRFSSNERREFEVDDSPLAAFARVPGVAARKRLQYAQSVVPVLQLAVQAKKKQLALGSQQQQEQEQEIVRAEHAERRRLLEFERASLLKEIDTNVAAFEEAVDNLRVERQQLTGDLKQAELKLLTYFQEYQLLLQFEGRDLALQQKQTRSKRESAEISTQIAELEVKLEGKREELKHWQGKGAVVANEFRSLIPENHAYVEQLTKIFRRKIKRKQGGDDGAEEDDQQEQDEDEDEDDEDEDAEDVCPVGCDPAVYEQVLQLRDRRLDVDDASADVQKGLDETRKALDRLKQRDKQVSKDVAQVEVEIRQFQKQKLSALNQIDIFVPLSLSQIYAFGPSGVLTGPEPKEKPQPPAGAAADGAAAAAPEVSEEELLVAAMHAELRDVDKRALVPDSTVKSHVIINTE